MKKLALMLLFALPMGMFFYSCDSTNDDDLDDDTELTLDKTSANLNYGDSITLTASLKDCTWSSDNEFVAIVKDGVVYGEHEGSAIITASKDSVQVSCEITVKATNNNFAIPVINWDASVDSIKGIIKNLTLDNEGVVDENGVHLTYLEYSTNGTYPKYVYSFPNDKLKASSINVSEAMDAGENGLTEFLLQRYELIGADDNGAIIYANGKSLEAATLSVTWDLIEENGEYTVLATWAPIEHVDGVRGGKAFVNTDLHKKHIEIVRKSMKK